MIIYALVARGSLVLAEYTPHDGDFPSLARRILAKSSYSKSKTSFTKDDFTFTFFSEDDFTFLCMTKTTVSREVSHKFLDELAVQFNAKYKKDDNSGKSWTAILTLIIKELIERYDVKKPDDKLEQIEDDLHVIVNVAQDNIDKLLERGQTLESIQAKASSMKYSAENFRRSTKKLQRSAIIEKYKNISIGVVAFVAVSYLGYVFIL